MNVCWMNIWLKQFIHQILIEHFLCAKEYAGLEGCRMNQTQSQPQGISKDCRNCFLEYFQKLWEVTQCSPFQKRWAGTTQHQDSSFIWASLGLYLFMGFGCEMIGLTFFQPRVRMSQKSAALSSGHLGRPGPHASSVAAALDPSLASALGES